MIHTSTHMPYVYTNVCMLCVYVTHTYTFIHTYIHSCMCSVYVHMNLFDKLCYPFLLSFIQ